MTFRTFDALVFAGVGLIVGCAAASRSIDHQEQQVLKSPRFDFARMKSGGLSLLGVTSEHAPEGIRDDVAFVMDQAVPNALPSTVKIVSRKETIVTAREAGMTADVQRLIRGYESQGVMDQGLLRRIAVLEGVRYYMVTSIEHYGKVNREIGASPNAPVGIPPSYAPTARRNYERVQLVKLRGEIWDSRCGEVVWIAEGETQVEGDTQDDDVRLNEVASMAVKNLVGQLPKSTDGRATQKEC